MDVARRRISFGAQHQRRLGVRLQADDAVDHVDARVFEGLRPFDVGRLIERPSIDEHRDLLACS